jgi:hypothetical protein
MNKGLVAKPVPSANCEKCHTAHKDGLAAKHVGDPTEGKKEAPAVNLGY